MLAWWRDAGVDVLVDDTPRDWLQPTPPPAAAPDAAPVAAVARPETLPTSLPQFHEWLATAEFALAGPPPTRLAAAGDPAADLMVLTDLPESGDEAAATLLSGEAGALFDRMLAAIGRDRSSIYLAALSVTRTPDGKIDPDGCAALAPIARHHIALVRPHRVLLLGDCVVPALLGQPLPEARGGLRHLNQDGANMACVATFHPRFLLRHPAFKAQAWQDLRLLLGGMSR